MTTATRTKPQTKPAPKATAANQTTPPAAARLTEEAREKTCESLNKMFGALDFMLSFAAFDGLSFGDQKALQFFATHEGDTATVDAVWKVLQIDYTSTVPGFQSPNDAKALAYCLLATKYDFRDVAIMRDDAAAFDAMLLQDATADTPFGSIRIGEHEGTAAVWFGRAKSGTPPRLHGNALFAAARKLFSVAETKAGPSQSCRVCGCTDDDCQQCIEATGETCTWVEPDLCSRCGNKDIDRTGDGEPDYGKKLPKASAKSFNAQPKAPAASRDTKPAKRESKAAKSETTVMPISSPMRIDMIDVVHNARTQFDGPDLIKLSKSIAKFGVLQPLLVKRNELCDSERWTLIAGERRLRAAKLVGLFTVPVTVVSGADAQTTTLMALEENLKRVDLNPIDRARELQRLITDHGMTQAQVGEFVGVSQGQVSSEIRLLQLPEDWRKKIAAGDVAPTLARQLLPYCDVPSVLECVGHKIADDKDPLTDETLKDYLHEAVLECSRPLKYDSAWQAYSKPQKTTRHFQKCSPADLKALEPRTFDFMENWKGKERTFNITLFDQLNKEPLARRMEAHNKQAKLRTHSRSRVADNEKKVDPLKEYKHWDAKRMITTWLNVQLAAALGESKNAADVDKVILALAIFGELDTIAEHRHSPRYIEKTIDMIDGDSKLMLKKLKPLVINDLKPVKNAPNNGVDPAKCVALAAILGVDIAADWKPSAELLNQFSDHGLQLCRELVLPEATLAKGKALIDGLVTRWPPGLIPEFLREFFGLPKLQGKNPAAKKKAKAA